jgi:hypothetical protein
LVYRNCVEYFSVDKGGKDVEVVISGMEANEDDSISGSKCEDDCVGEGTMGWECSGERHERFSKGESGD